MVIISRNSLVFSREIITSTGFYRYCAPGASAPVVVIDDSPRRGQTTSIAGSCRRRAKRTIGGMAGKWHPCQNHILSGLPTSSIRSLLPLLQLIQRLSARQRLYRSLLRTASTSGDHHIDQGLWSSLDLAEESNPSPAQKVKKESLGVLGDPPQKESKTSLLKTRQVKRKYELGDKVQGPSWGQKRRKRPLWHHLDPRFEWFEVA